MVHAHPIAVNADDPRPLYVQIVDEVRRGILRGTLPPDTPLPSVRELSRDLRVNPNTVQQAYRELERAGEVYVRRGQGTFVAPGVRRAPDLRARVLREAAEQAVREAARAGLSATELAHAILALGETEEPGVIPAAGPRGASAPDPALPDAPSPSTPATEPAP